MKHFRLGRLCFSPRILDDVMHLKRILDSLVYMHVDERFCGRVLRKRGINVAGRILKVACLCHLKDPGHLSVDGGWETQKLQVEGLVKGLFVKADASVVEEGREPDGKHQDDEKDEVPKPGIPHGLEFLESAAKSKLY